MSNIKKQIEFSMTKVNDRALRNAKMDIRDFQKLLERIMKEKNYNSIEEAMKYIEKRYYDIFFSNKGIKIDKGNLSIDTDTTKSDYFELKTYQVLKKKPQKILEVLDKMSSQQRTLLLPKEKPFIRYTPDMNSNYETVLKELSGYIVDSLKIDRQKFIDGTLSYEERIKFQEAVSSIASKYTTILSSDIRNACIRRINSMAKLLDEKGEFEVGTRRYNTIMEKIGLEELQVEYEKKKKGNKPQFTTMKDLENPKVVEKIPFDSLIGISVFLTNRLAKKFSSYKKAKFILDQKGKLEDLPSEINISDNELKGILGKFDYLQGLCRSIYSETAAIVFQEYQDADRDIEENIFSREITITSVDNEDEYKKTFDKILPKLDNSFLEDIGKFTASNNIFEGIYKRKDYDFHTLITSLIDKDSDQINWGYIPEQRENGNSIQRNKKMILIGVDFEGFNFPIRLHCSKSELLDLVQKYTGKEEIPVYRGDEDWNVKTNDNEKFDMTAQVITNFDKRKRKFINQLIKELKEDDLNYNYILHLNWLISPLQVPEKLKKRECVSLVTGDIKEIEDKCITY